MYLRNSSHSMYDVFPNGREFPRLLDESRRSELSAVVHWTEERRRELRAR